MLRYVLLCFYGLTFCSGQSVYPSDYFRNPLDIPIVLSGSFGELRSSHFHAGLDIKTQRKEGLNVYTAAEGYVSRIKISHFGYGKAIYITHPNGYTSVYGHLKKLSKRLETYIKYCQYDNESYEVEVFPSPYELPISKDELIAYSGNTGSSGGPHLHFEIRDNLERPINPLYFGYKVKDTKSPFVTEIYAYPKNDTSFINGYNTPKKLRLIPQKNGDYKVESISAIGEIGFGIVANDQQDLAPNRNGLYQIETLFNGSRQIKIEFSRISFAESKHIKRYVDYKHFKTTKRKIQKLFIEKNNPLSIFKQHNNNGYISVEDSTASVFKIKLNDYAGNTTWVHLQLKGNASFKAADENKTVYSPLIPRVFSGEDFQFVNNNISLDIYKNTFYDDVLLDIKTKGDTLLLGDDITPMQKHAYITFDISKYKPPYKDKLYVSRVYGYYKTPYYINTKHKGNTLVGKTKALGTYTVTVDTIAPTITPKNFTHKKWLSKYRYLKIKIEDDKSGISKYRATVNGKWILMEYDYKTKTLTHNFNDGIITDTKNNLKLIVTDNVGNSSKFEAIFYRK